MTQDVFSVVKGSVRIPLIADIPHSSTNIPSSIRPTFILNDGDLEMELLRMTDRYVDQLFSDVPDVGGISVVYNCSRLVVDPERFENDEKEVMSFQGMGVIYTKTSDGNKLRANIPSEDERQELLNRYYRPYHKAMEDETQAVLHSFGRCLILDCHSFPSEPLPYELNQDANRPDICLGTDPYHTPKRLTDFVERFFEEHGLTTERNMPFEGTYVPLKFLGTDKRVSSLMVEINRKLYMNEATGEKSGSFEDMRNVMSEMLKCITANISAIS